MWRSDAQGSEAALTGTVAVVAMTATEHELTPDITRYRRGLESLLGIPATEGNQVDVLRNGDRIFPASMAAWAGFSWAGGRLKKAWDARATPYAPSPK